MIVTVELNRQRDQFNLELEPGDRAILEAIAKEDSSRSMGATLRKLIRDEARRRGLHQQPSFNPVQS